MHVIFFGAGASYGSDRADTPPIGPNLFNALARWSPNDWGALRPPWPAKFAANFEEAMAEIIAASHFGAPLQWSMAEYFFKCFQIRENNLYIRLLKDIARTDKDAAFVTLNYDTLLFQASARGGVAFSMGKDRRNGTRFPLCLPHGSSVFKNVGPRADPRGASFGAGVSTGARTIEMMSTPTEFDQERRTNAFPPVMSYFEPNKFTVSATNFIERQRQRFATLIGVASKIAIVGVNVHTLDKHIWEPIANARTNCFYLAGATGDGKYRDWCKDVGRNGDTVCAKYFADGYNELLAFIA